MAASTTTLLELVNLVLLDSGERAVTSLDGNPAAKKATQYCKDAFEDMTSFHTWEWSYGLEAVNSFTNDTTTIDNVRRIRHILWSGDNRYFVIPYMSLPQYLTYELESFDSSTNSATRPLRWTKTDEETLRFNPYPTDEDGRDSIRVDCVKYLAPPTTATGTFPCPERFVNALRKRASYQMMKNHVGDLQAAQAMQQEFFEALQTFRSQESGLPTTGGSMFRSDVPNAWRF